MDILPLPAALVPDFWGYFKQPLYYVVQGGVGLAYHQDPLFEEHYDVN